MLCRAIVEPKPILLLDEFFSSLDTKLSRQLAKNLKSFLPADTIIIIISHRDSDFEFCDEVYALNQTLTKSQQASNGDSVEDFNGHSIKQNTFRTADMLS